MKNFTDILMLLVALVLPMALGYFFRLIRLFNDKESDTLRKFVVRVSVPFLIFKALYTANVSILGQFFPAAFSFFLLTSLYTGSGFYISRFISKESARRNAFSFAVSMGNYAFLGWGVVYSFYGEEAFARAVFFTMLFWPIFLLHGFWLVHRQNRHSSKGSVVKLIVKNAAVPVTTAITGMGMNILHIPVPDVVWGLVEKFAAFVIPMILFTIGLNFKLIMPRSNLVTLTSAIVYRLFFGFGLGLVALSVARVIFPIDLITQKVVLIQSIMPTATMVVFFVEYTEMDKELLSGIIALSTLVSLITIPLWYAVVERLF